MEADPTALTACDREPIHTPGAIQPHGVLLVVDRATLTVPYAAGDTERVLGCTPAPDLTLEAAVGAELAQQITALPEQKGFAGRLRAANGDAYDVVVNPSGRWLLVEMEPTGSGYASPAAALGELETAALAFERATSLQGLCELAAQNFRVLTGFDRVMVYRFLEGGAGVVLAEALRPDMHAFRNHHFPATDIPVQARALYVRNPVRVIPDITYDAAPLRPVWGEAEPLDMSDSTLRSVSPVHLRYLANMGVRASASVSIVKDNQLWGLIACHNETPRALSFDVRASCRVLAAGLARHIKAREEIDIYRERIRLRSFEDDIAGLLSREGTLDEALSNHLTDVRRMLSADGVAVLRGRDIVTDGACPDDMDVRALARFVLGRPDGVFATESLSKVVSDAAAYMAVASGLLGITLSVEDPWVVLWFRAEHIETVNWAGNPHKDTEARPDEMLTPRASFDAWREVVKGRARPWSLVEVDAAKRLRQIVLSLWQNRRLHELNASLRSTIAEKDLLIQQKQYLLGEVNHRVQNSLQLVSSFLALQARESTDPSLELAVEEARRRISAVSLVHRRLYRLDQVETVDADRYIDELLSEQFSAMGADWTGHISRDLAPVVLTPDRAVSLGLILAELVTNAQKYAYDGAAGPLHVSLAEDPLQFRLAVTDLGRGRTTARSGFGTKMMSALVAQLGGTLNYANTNPGLEAVLTAPVHTAPAVPLQ